MLSRKERLILSFICVLGNLISIITGTLVGFVFYGLLGINSYDVNEGWLKLLSGLGICGAVQGFIVAALQTILLLLAKLEIIKLFVTNIASMAVGMTLPMTYAIVTRSELEISGSFDNYVIAGWKLSWMLAGIFGGVIAGRNKNQKILWGLINAGAYLYWVIAATFGVRLLGAALDNTPDLSTLIDSFFVIASMLGIGGWLNSYIFRGLIRSQRQNV